MLIAVFHALQSLLTPRHPPYALSNLTTKIKRSSRTMTPRNLAAAANRAMREVYYWRLFDSPVLTGDSDEALPKNIASTRSTDTPGGRVTISPSPAPLAFSCELARRASNAKCLGELSNLCPLATDTTLNSRNRTKLPVSARLSDKLPKGRTATDASFNSRCQLPQPNCQRTIWSAFTRPGLHPSSAANGRNRATQ
jgi:hypothetical protein